MPLVIVTQPASYPVSLDEAKSHCRVTDAAHDARLTLYIAAATATVEARTGMLLVQQTVRLELDAFPEWEIMIPVAPIQSVASVIYDNSLNVATTMVANTDYFTSLAGQYPKIVPVTAWPSTYLNKPNCVRVLMVAGYAGDSVIIPPDIKHAILVRIKELFDHGGETILGYETNPSANTVSALTAPHRRWNV
jgi:uncharacterized phiE125 gp8 family phage protein